MVAYWNIGVLGFVKLKKWINDKIQLDHKIIMDIFFGNPLFSHSTIPLFHD
jgi:hypothetical protein